MKHIIAGVLAAILMMPAVSFAQSTLEEQYRSYLVQLIALLQAQIAELIELQNMSNENEVEEVSVGGGDEPEIDEAPATPEITASLGDVKEERDDKGRVFFSWSVSTDGEKMQVKLERPDGGYVIEGGLNKETDKTFEIGPENPGVFKWTVTAVKDGVEATESGQFEIQ